MGDKLRPREPREVSCASTGMPASKRERLGVTTTLFLKKVAVSIVR